jgi:hypothetical protein
VASAQALKINVDMLKLIQLGLTFTNAGACLALVRSITEYRAAPVQPDSSHSGAAAMAQAG